MSDLEQRVAERSRFSTVPNSLVVVGQVFRTRERVQCFPPSAVPPPRLATRQRGRRHYTIEGLGHG